MNEWGRNCIRYREGRLRVFVSAEWMTDRSWQLYPGYMYIGKDLVGPLLTDDGQRQKIVERVKLAFEFMRTPLKVFP